MSKDQGTLYLKHRPKEFTDMVGNESTLNSLSVILSREAGHVKSFLLYGPSGCGKTTIARILKTKLDCADEDFHEYNVANTRGIDTIREIIKNSRYAPMIGEIKIYLLDECHQLSRDAQNGLLKILEDTPDHVRFILCTTNVTKLIPTIRNRCSDFPVSELRKNQIIKLLKSICEKEGVSDFPEKFLTDIAKSSRGSPRKALTILDKVIDLVEDDDIEEAIRVESIREVEIIDICKILTGKSKSWKQIAEILKNIDLSGNKAEDARYIIKQWLGTTFLNSNGNQKIADMLVWFCDSFRDSGREGLMIALFEATKI